MTTVNARDTNEGANPYALRGGEDGKRRMDLIAGVLRPSTLALLERVGIRAGDRCLDVGCGAGHVARELARMAGPQGRVLGIDSDPKVLELAAQETAGIANLSFQQGDVRTLQGDGYDVVYARFLLTHMPDPAAVLARMAACLKPGGKLVVEDIDHGRVVCEPPSPAYARYTELYEELIGRRGGDLRIGLKLLRLLRQAGAGEVELHIVQPAFTSGPAKHAHVVTLDSITDALQAEGMATAAEVAALRADMLRFDQAKDTVVTFPRIIQAWGRLA
jgi:SAM-dependent methyltransferase